MTLAPRRNWDGKPVLLIALIWLISRGLVLFAVCPRIPFYWEVFEVKKLWEYGFLHRAGALVNIQYLPGHLSNPEVFNYVNHPYPIMWLFAAAYRVCGPWGMMAVVLSLGLASCVAVLVVLTRSFTRRAAFFAALLFVLAPSAILFDADTNIVALGAVIWPASALVASYADGNHQNRWSLALILGIVVFVCGQISWFVLTTLPALLTMTARSDLPFARQYRTPWGNPFWVAIIAGGAATFCLFLLQVFLYSPHLSESFAYAFAHTGSGDGFFSSRGKMVVLVLSKCLLLVGPALVTGALAGLISLRKRESTFALARGAVVALCCALLVALVLVRFYYRERTPYSYLLFPAVVLTACALEKARTWLYVVLGALSLIGLAYVGLQVSAPSISKAGLTLADFLQKTTRRDDVIVSNLREQQPPFPSWDTGSREVTMLAADRLLYYDVETTPQLIERKKQFESQKIPSRWFFLRDLRRPISPELEQSLSTTQHLRRSLVLPMEDTSPVLKLRSFYWRAVGSPFSQKDGETPSGARSIDLELHEVH